MTTPIWAETESGATINVNDTTLVSLHKEYIPVEHRLQPVNPPEDIDVKTRLQEAGAVDAVIPVDWQAALDRWLVDRWEDALDAWVLFGEPIWSCPHYDRISAANDVSHWFARWPTAMLCSICGPRVATALDADPGSCDHCREPSPEYKRLVAPGTTMAAHVVLCWVCMCL